VTGGGWIESPAGAYTADPALAGRASFGLVAGYKREGALPTGNIDFHLSGARLQFHATAYESLEIEGARAILVSVTGGSDLCLSEFEEVLKIITASADREALIIAGTSINGAMSEQIKVTVVATGFNGRRQLPVKEQPGEEPKGDIISYDEWIKMRKGVSAAAAGAPTNSSAIHKGPGDFLVGRNSKEADLNVPTVLREKKLLQQGDG